MPIANPMVRDILRSALRLVLDYDNQWIGVILLLIAGQSWFEFFRRYFALRAFISHGFYTLPAVNLLVLALSAVYITSVSLISLTAKKPRARYETLVPNLITLIAAFSVYCFGLLPPTEARVIPVLVPLSLMAAGGALVLVSLIFLRRAFSVTPQARHLVNSGPYSMVRHPMYDGNIITFLGLALLIGTVPAMLLFVVTAALQIYRANREERLLENTVPDYAAYKARVGAFLPKWSKVAPQLLAALVCLVLASPTASIAQGSGGALALGQFERVDRTAIGQTLPIFRVQAGGVEGRCRDWYARAISGAWFTQQDKTQFDATESRQEALEKLSGCRDFFRLQSKCQSIYYDGMDKPAATLRTIEATPGCKSIVGFDSICDMLNQMKSLNASQKAISSQCLDQSVVSSRGGLLRPGL